MKKLMIIACLSVAFLAHSHAQDRRTPPSPAQRAERMSQRMADQLALTAEQKKEVYSIYLDRFQKSTANRKDQHERMASIREEMVKDREKIDSLLTPEQRQKWTELRAEANEGRRQRFKRKPGMYKKADSLKSDRRSRTGQSKTDQE